MKKISDILEKRGSNIPPEHTITNILPAIIKKHAKTEIPPRTISIQHGIVFIKASSAVKLEIFLKKRDILGALARATKGQTIRDIK